MTGLGDRHIRNCLGFSLNAASRINVALAHSVNVHAQEALMDALHSTLIVAEECRQHIKEAMDAEREREAAAAQEG